MRDETTHSLSQTGDNSTLYFSVGNAPIHLQGTTISEQTYEKKTISLCGTQFEMRIIGFSHHIRSSAFDFVEVLSCIPLSVRGHTPTVIDLHEQKTRHVEYETKQLTAQLSIEVRKGMPNRSSIESDLHHRFAEDAHTIISASVDSYETWHTYPELNTTVYSRTTIQRDEENGM